MENRTYDLELSKKLYKHYIENEIGYNKTCQYCKTYNEQRGRVLKNGPIPVFHIGDLFSQTEIRLLILGTVAYGWENELPNLFVEDKDVRNKHLESTIEYIENRISQLFEERKMKFFTYISDSLSQNEKFSDKAIRKIAISNLIKCNMGSDQIRNHHLQKNYDFCIREEYTGNLISDVNILDPTHIIILSSNRNKFWRYGKLFMDQDRKVEFIHHPSSSTAGGKKKFIEDVNNFLNSDN